MHFIIKTLLVIEFEIKLVTPANDIVSSKSINYLSIESLFHERYCLITATVCAHKLSKLAY